VNAKQIWQATIERLRTEVNPQVFTTWFQGTTARSFQDGIFVICVASTFAKSQLENRFLNLIRPILTDIIGSDVEIRVEVARVQTESSEATRARRNSRFQKGQGHFLSNRFGTPLRNKRGQDATATPNTARSSSALPASPSQINTPHNPQEDYSAVQHFRPEKVPVEPMSLTSHPQPQQAKRQFQSPTPTPKMLPLTRQEDLHSEPQRIEPLRDSQPLEPQREIQPNPHHSEPPRRMESPFHQQEYSPSILHTPGEGLLSQRYTFSTFIVGKSNKLAHATSLAVAESPGRLYNPLFLYGGVGLGKTHLLHAIGHAGEAEGLYVLYTTSEKFTNEIINAIRFKKTEEFRAKYRQIDILLIDDIQFIAGKESTEEEFFHTFNALHNANKQIVVTSDRPPKAISSLQDRLRSRFEWGLQADVRPPEYEHRLEILRSKCNSLHFTIPNNIIEYIARPECSSVRELEGALNRVIAYGTLHDKPLTIELAAQALQHIYDKKPPVTTPLTVNEVFEGVSKYYNLNQEVLRGKQRERDIVWPRQVTMYLMREEATASWLQIGAILGGRDHTTVMHGYEKVKAEIANNEVARQEVAAVLASLRHHSF
jgi:chromosomal replication initiator protein